MPQIKFEYSNNIIIDNPRLIAFEIHKILAKYLPTEIINCKTRIIKYDNYLIGEGNEKDSFLHLDILIMPGRDEESIKKIGNILLEYMKDVFIVQNNDGNLQISVKIENLPNIYYRAKI